MQNVMLSSYQKQSIAFVNFLTRRISDLVQGTLQKINTTILYLRICIYLLHIGQLQPKKVLQLHQCYKLHTLRVQRCHHWSLSPFGPNRHQHYCYYYTTTNRKHVNLRKIIYRENLYYYLHYVCSRHRSKNLWNKITWL